MLLMDNPKPLYCTVQDHIYMARYGLDTCPKCGGSTQKYFEIDKEHFEKTLTQGIWGTDGLDLLDKLIQPNKEDTMRHRITAFGVACAFLVCCIVVVWAMMTFSGCAMLQRQPQYKTFKLTIDGEKVVVNLPNELPSMDEAIYGGERCWDTKLCAQQFCLSDEIIHGHVRFFYSGKKIVVLGWWDEENNERQWLYKEGISIEVSYEKLTIFLDSLWKKVPDNSI